MSAFDNKSQGEPRTDANDSPPVSTANHNECMILRGKQVSREEDTAGRPKTFGTRVGRVQ
jgi:hypothetical protein